MPPAADAILVFHKHDWPHLPEAATWPLAAWPQRWHWHSRAHAETDESRLQLIPYLLLENAAGQLWTYRRKGGDPRVQARFSCGVGGHVDFEDARESLAETAAVALQRELAEELVAPDCSPPEPCAWLYEHHSAIGRTHLGLIYRARWLGAAPPRTAPDEALEAQGFMAAEAIAADPRFELWSRLAARHGLGPERYPESERR